MRKLIILGLMAATVMPAAANAQTRREVREDARDLRDANRDLRDAQRRGDRRDVRDARRDVREARRDYRDEVRDYRQRNRALYRQGSYAGPRGYVWRPAAVGGRLQAPLYGQRYYIANPVRYRLPGNAGANVWVRHGNDALLVNSRTGVVRDVYRGFFW